jgi:hypothetical protein
MIQVTCPSCTQQFQTDDRNAGRPAKCPNCQDPITIPNPAAWATGPPMAHATGAAPAMAVPVGKPVGHSGVAVAGFVCGLSAVVLGLVPCVGLFLSMPAAIAGIVCSSIGLANAKRENKKSGLAIAGLVLSILGLVGGPFLSVVAFAPMSMPFLYGAASRLM